MPAYRGADGAALHHDVLGADAAPPLVVLAGGAAAHPSYLGDLAGLGERYRLVVPHLRGVGRSADAPLTSRWQQADDVDALRAALGLDRCTLVAHSAGTRLAVAYAARYPHRLAALVLLTPPADHLVDVPSDAARIAAARSGDPAFRAATAAAEEGPDLGSDGAFATWRLATAALGYARWDATTQAHAGAVRYSLAAARAFLAGEGPADLLDRLRAVHAPTLVVAGAQDAVTGLAPVLAVADLFPHGRVAVIDDCGHFPWVEQPAAFRAAVDPFLAGSPR
ncbi:pimeloyl-ACP methyl ester carboxylesterase [Geodermatophilus bullaregiensis]|uniref:alpha/beta fold hydrolase n=1 Tax=Geodermatophilus bullaregiensis TaxID=1564160 RepID=UPI00195E4B2F|nr:alpha/beta hydrolase [Geodermatophilus bullaregiensis]MBM7804944.1 pimeloyl-ACP methyl ester carboxylesterase [Geodermatophilus bullaregiensis]